MNNANVAGTCTASKAPVRSESCPRWGWPGYWGVLEGGCEMGAHNGSKLGVALLEKGGDIDVALLEGKKVGLLDLSEGSLEARLGIVNNARASDDGAVVGPVNLLEGGVDLGLEGVDAADLPAKSLERTPAQERRGVRMWARAGCVLWGGVRLLGVVAVQVPSELREEGILLGSHPGDAGGREAAAGRHASGAAAKNARQMSGHTPPRN